MTEVSQIDAAGSAVLDSLLYSDGAVPSSPIRIPSPVRGQSVEPLFKHAFFNPTDVGATLAFMEQAGLEPLAEEDIEVSNISTEESSKYRYLANESRNPSTLVQGQPDNAGKSAATDTRALLRDICYCRSSRPTLYRTIGRVIWQESSYRTRPRPTGGDRKWCLYKGHKEITGGEPKSDV